MKFISFLQTEAVYCSLENGYHFFKNVMLVTVAAEIKFAAAVFGNAERA